MADNWIVAVVSDLHVNSSAGLWPKKYTLDDGQTVKQSTVQRWLWQQWCEYWRIVEDRKQATGARVFVVVNGDATDKNRHSHYQLITDNEADIIDATVEVLQPAVKVADELAIVRGTEAHVGGCGWMEEALAKDVATFKPSDKVAAWWWLPLKIGDAYLAFAHHPGKNSHVRWTVGGAAIRAASELVMEYFGEAEYQELVTYGHIHHDEDSADNQPIRVLTLPPFKAHEAYDMRNRAGRRFVVGGNLYTVRLGQLCDVEKVRFVSKREKVRTL